MPDVITTYSIFKAISSNEDVLFWIVEYNPTMVQSPIERYSILRNEILQNPHNYIERLESGIYRIWTTTPYEKSW